MKQPLMIIPPAQAEALYDASLEDIDSSAFSHLKVADILGDDWDDQSSSDGINDGPFIEPRRLGNTPKFPYRTAMKPSGR